MSKPFEFFTGFPEHEVPVPNTGLQERIKRLSDSIPRAKGRPPKLLYPGYMNKDEDPDQSQPFYGFPSQSRNVLSSGKKRSSNSWLGPISVA